MGETIKISLRIGLEITRSAAGIYSVGSVETVSSIVSPPPPGFSATPTPPGLAATPPSPGFAATPPSPGFAATPPPRGSAATPPPRGSEATPPPKTHQVKNSSPPLRSAEIPPPTTQIPPPTTQPVPPPPPPPPYINLQDNESRRGTKRKRVADFFDAKQEPQAKKRKLFGDFLVAGPDDYMQGVRSPLKRLREGY